MNKTDEFELGITEPTRDELVARIEALEAQHREDTSAIAVLGADREAAMKASAAALREVDALKARIGGLEAVLRYVVTQERRVAASTDMTRSAMREGAAELAYEIDAALGALPLLTTKWMSMKAKGSFTRPSP